MPSLPTAPIPTHTVVGARAQGERLSAQQFHLVLLDTERAGTVFPLANEALRVGKAPDNDVVIDHPTVSRNHLVVRRQGDRFLVQDLDSTNGTFLDGAQVREAYLRPGALLREQAKAGTFVEIKNSDIGEGTKVPHLSYLGDADVGPGTNIGASNVTANYDGREKHRTTIGANVKTSVDTTFVAPVTIGDRAWTAAGSVITEDVPEDALGVARARQRNVEGYARRKG
jgi:acetyltransferase-like isoleucine patch superfamily enzyme